MLDAWGSGSPSELAVAIDERQKSGLPLFDLVNTSVQKEGFEFDQDLLAECMAEGVKKSRYYVPHAQGNPEARAAVAGYHGHDCSPDDIILTPGSSLAYYYAFRLLANPGEEILCPQPTYPLFDDLAFLAGVRVRRYYLNGTNATGWRFDAHDLEFQITPATRAIVMVSPHNPTGMVINPQEMSAIADIARRHHLPIVFDEVFREFTHLPNLPVCRPSEFDVPLCLTLNGFSKMFSLPGMKIGWIVVEGADTALKNRFLQAISYLNDSLLPVQETTQAAVSMLFERGICFCQRAADLSTERVRAMSAHWRSCGWSVPEPEAGPYLILDSNGGLETRQEELDFVRRLVRDEGIVFHPAEFYGLPTGAIICTAVSRPPWPQVICPK